MTRRRLLFAAAGGHGHLRPLLPLASRARRDGHEVLVTGAAALAPHVTSLGLPYAATGPDLVPQHRPLVVQDVDREREAVGTYFVGRLGRARARDVLALARTWRPDVVVRDEVDVGAAVAAEALSLPHAAVVVIGAGGFILPSVVAGPLRDLRREHGLPPDEPMQMLHRHLTLTPFPAAFRDPADPLPGRVQEYRDDSVATPVERTGPVQVLVTLGTIFNTESGDLLGTMARGAAAAVRVDRVVVTTGEHLPTDVLSALPANVEVHRFLDQDRTLATCAAVVSHAGSGTVLGALRHGLPMVCLPLGADQPLNARRVEDLGLGVSLPADLATEGQVAAALDRVLSDGTFAERTRALGDRLQAHPGLDVAVRALAGLCG